MKATILFLGVAMLSFAQTPPVKPPTGPPPNVPVSKPPVPTPTETAKDLTDHQKLSVREAQVALMAAQTALDQAQTAYRESLNGFNTVRTEIEKECGGSLRETPATGPDGKPKGGNLTCVVAPAAPAGPYKAPEAKK